MVAQGTAPLPLEWETTLSRLVRYKIITSSTSGCDGIGEKSVFDDQTGQITCTCPAGKYCVATDETSSAPFVAAIVLVSIGLVLFMGAIVWLLWLDTRSTNVLYAIDFSRYIIIMERKKRRRRMMMMEKAGLAPTLDSGK
jgi:hypothetical protein